MATFAAVRPLPLGAPVTACRGRVVVRASARQDDQQQQQQQQQQPRPPVRTARMAALQRQERQEKLESAVTSAHQLYRDHEFAQCRADEAAAALHAMIASGVFEPGEIENARAAFRRHSREEVGLRRRMLAVLRNLNTM